MDIEQILARLPEKPRGKIKSGFNCICPAHNDTKPSLSVTQDGNEILIHCHSGCDYQRVLDLLGLTKADLFLDTKEHYNQEPIVEYSYQNLDGTPRFTIKRLPDKPDGKKDFRAYLPGATKAGIGDTPKILYHAPEIIQAIENDQLIIIVEGEKDADTLRSAGELTATTAPFGAGAQWLPEYTKLLRNARVLVLPDTDSAGIEYAKKVCSALYGSVKSLKVVVLQGAKDITEWLEKGGTIDYLKDLIVKAPEFQPRSPEAPVKPKPSLINKPEASYRLNHYSYNWQDLGICVEVNQLRDNGSGELTFWHDGTERKLLHFARVNLLSTQACSQVAKRLRLNLDVDWDTILTFVSQLSLQEYRKGGAIEELCTSDGEIEPPPYLISPFAIEDNHTIIFGEGKSGKSLFALLLAITGCLPWCDNDLDLKVQDDKPIPVLYLDWERSKTVAVWRLNMLKRGQSLPHVKLDYYKCKALLPDMTEWIIRGVHNKGFKLLIVDSVGASMGGNINDAETALHYYNALSQIGIPSIGLHHTSKDPLTKKKTPFGSVYFTNYASSVWECKASKDTDVMTISLKETANNFDNQHKTIGYEFSFNRPEKGGKVENITVKKIDLSKTELSSELHLKDRIYNLLIDEGKMELKDIATALDEPQTSVKAKLYKYNGKLFIKVNKEWGAIYQGELGE